MKHADLELIDSYVKEVGQYLPRESRGDIARDLHEAVLEEVFALAEAAGRAPTLVDQQTVLARFGHPFKVAGGYLPQRYLIGPELYQQMVRTLKMTLAIALAGLVICYFCVSVLWQTKEDFRFIIPYVEFARESKGLKPYILDTSVVIDGRIADLIETGIVDNPLIMPMNEPHPAM